MPGLKVHVAGALRFLETRAEDLYASLGETIYLEDFRTAFLIGAIFPDFHYHAPFKRAASHDDPLAVECAACKEAVEIDTARCPSCKGEWWPRSTGGRDFDARYVAPKGDEAKRTAAYTAADDLESRLARERIVRVRLKLGGAAPGVPRNWFAGAKLPLEAHLKLDKAFFDAVKQVPWGDAGLEALSALKRSHLGFYVGVAHHLALDRALEPDLDPVALFRLEMGADGARAADLAKAGQRLAAWAAAPDAGKLAVKQAAWGILGRWKTDARAVKRRERDGREFIPGEAKYGVSDPKIVIGDRLASFVRTAGAYVGTPAAAAIDAARALVAPSIEAEAWRIDPRFPCFGAPRQYDPVPEALLEAAKGGAASAEDIFAPVDAAGEKLVGLLKEGYPRSFGETNGERFYARRRGGAELDQIHPIVLRPWQVADDIFRREDMKHATGAESAWGKAFKADGSENAEWKDEGRAWLRSMDGPQFVQYCLWLSNVDPDRTSPVAAPAGTSATAPADGPGPLLGKWKRLYAWFSRDASKGEIERLKPDDIVLLYRGAACERCGIATGEKDRMIYLSGDSSPSCAANVCEYLASHFLKSPERPRASFDAVVIGRYLGAAS